VAGTFLPRQVAITLRRDGAAAESISSETQAARSAMIASVCPEIAFQAIFGACARRCKA